MIKLEQFKDLSHYSTLACPSMAQWYVSLADEADIPELVGIAAKLNKPIFILGGGSNIVLEPNIDGLVIRNQIKGIETLSQSDESLLLKVGAGENWHEFVTWCVTQNLSGVENLSLIPGTVGAAPVQNIGAYGVEVSSLIERVNAYDIVTQKSIAIANADCNFRYRDSLFKDHEGRFIITSVVLRLNKRLVANLSYGPLSTLAKDESLTVKKIYDTVIDIRTEKLPDPMLIPNAGSFFKNPVISTLDFQPLFDAFPNIVHFAADEQIKLAAGWLIDQAGLKGQSNRFGVGCYQKQALVVVNPKYANGDSVLEWSETVKQKVFDKFGVMLEMEPRVWR